MMRKLRFMLPAPSLADGSTGLPEMSAAERRNVIVILQGIFSGAADYIAATRERDGKIACLNRPTLTRDHLPRILVLSVLLFGRIPKLIGRILFEPTPVTIIEDGLGFDRRRSARSLGGSWKSRIGRAR